MARIKQSKYGETAFQKLLGHNLDVLYAWNQLGELLEKEINLSALLKEQVRRTLAQGNGCAYCKAKGEPIGELFDEKTAIAVGFAEVFLKQKGNIADSQFAILKDYFCDAEISELVAFITFTTTSQYFGAIMDLDASPSV